MKKSLVILALLRSAVLLLPMFCGMAHAQTITQSCTGVGVPGSCSFSISPNRMIIVSAWGYLNSPVMADTKGLSWGNSTGCSSYRAGPSFDVMNIQYAWTGSNSGSDTFTGTSVGTTGIVVVEVDGLLNTTPNPFNGACNQQDTGASPGGVVSSGNVTTPGNNFFVFGAGTSGGTDVSFTAGSGFTEINRIDLAAGSVPLIAEWKNAPTAGAWAATANQSVAGDEWMLVVLTFGIVPPTSAVRHKPNLINAPRERVKRKPVKI